MKKHKLTPEMDDALHSGREITGAELLEKDPGIKDAHGKPLDPKQKYFVQSLSTIINHLRRLRKAFKSGGQNAVVEYLRLLHTPETQPQS